MKVSCVPLPPVPVLLRPLLATTAFNLFNKIFALPAAAAAPSMLSNVPNKIERERETVKNVARCQRSGKLNSAAEEGKW